MSLSKGFDIGALENQLDRTHQFFPRVDGKAIALFALISGQVAVAALNLTPSDLRAWWVATPLSLFVVLALWVIFKLHRCAYPNLEGGGSSLLYFREIAKLREADFIAKCETVSEDEYAKDLAAQIWRNSEILSEKYKSLKSAQDGLMIGVIPWALFLLAASINTGRIPLVG